MKVTRFCMAAVLACAAVLFANPTSAQDQDPPAIAARIAWLTGNVSLETQGAQDWSVAPLNYPMVGGDRIFTDDGARAAIQSGGTDVRVWGGSDVTLTNLNEQYEQIGLAQGSIRVRIYSMQPDASLEVDTPNGAVLIQNPGDYRVNVYPDQQAALVEVNSGVVQIAGPGVNQEVDQGEAVQLYGSNPVEIGAVGMPPFDGLDNWSTDRDRHILNSVSARYVSRDIPGYDDLDAYGGWTATPDYGPIWFPTSVPYGWQPYTTGHWAYVAPWGYTWVDDAPWGYAPFHYGRWVVWGGRWGWVPGPPAVRPVYAPAFVAFVGGGPGFTLGVGFGGGGVAAWFPLGVAEPYIPWYHCSPAYVRTVNVSNVNITVIHNVTIVNNYNVFINRVSTARSVNEIQVNNITYVNRARVVAVPANAMTTGARVQQAVVHLNAQQQQQLARAPVATARPPAPPPAHPVVGARAATTRAAARPVLMTPHGRAAATPAANTAHFTAKSLPKPASAANIRPATHTVAPNIHPAAPAHTTAAPAAPARPQPQIRPAAPATNRPATPAVRPEASQPATRPRAVAPESHSATPPAHPATAHPQELPAPQPRPAPQGVRPATPAQHPQAHPAPGAKKPPPPKKEEKKPAKPEEQPQR